MAAAEAAAHKVARLKHAVKAANKYVVAKRADRDRARRAAAALPHTIIDVADAVAELRRRIAERDNAAAAAHTVQQSLGEDHAGGATDDGPADSGSGSVVAVSGRGEASVGADDGGVNAMRTGQAYSAEEDLPSSGHVGGGRAGTMLSAGPAELLCPLMLGISKEAQEEWHVVKTFDPAMLQHSAVPRYGPRRLLQLSSMGLSSAPAALRARLLIHGL